MPHEKNPRIVRKDPQTKRIVSLEGITGPIRLIVTTTTVKIDPALTDRCIVLRQDREDPHRGDKPHAAHS